MIVDRVKVTDWLRENWKGATLCPICAADNWSVGDHVIEIRVFQGKLQHVGGGNLYPYVQLICGTCGYTIFFNAIIMGLVDPRSYTATLEGAAGKKREE